MPPTSWAIGVPVVVVAGLVAPLAAATMLSRAARERSRALTVTNYRGERVSPWLVLPWAVWALGIVCLQLLAGRLETAAAWPEVSEAIRSTAWLPGLAILAVALFGLADDVFGSGDAKGFAGHLGALLRGTLTTGAVKLAGIGLLALYATSWIADAHVSARGSGARSGVWILAAVLVGVSANTVNLLDLRPGRALKGYGVLVLTAGALALGLGTRLGGAAEPAALAWACLLALGPAVATWRFDLAELGMLGDGGANAMGFAAGCLLASALPVWGMAVAAGLLLALNLASEFVSFSRVIEGNRLLRRVDELGRLPLGEDPEGPGQDA